MICVRINEGFEQQRSRLGEGNRNRQYCPSGRSQEIPIRVFADQAMMLRSPGIFMETMMPIGRNGEKAGEKPHRRGQTGHQPAETPRFRCAILAHKGLNAAGMLPKASKLRLVNGWQFLPPLHFLSYNCPGFVLVFMAQDHPFPTPPGKVPTSKLAANECLKIS